MSPCLFPRQALRCAAEADWCAAVKFVWLDSEGQVGLTSEMLQGDNLPKSSLFTSGAANITIAKSGKFVPQSDVASPRPLGGFQQISHRTGECLLPASRPTTPVYDKAEGNQIDIRNPRPESSLSLVVLMSQCRDLHTTKPTWRDRHGHGPFGLT